MFSFVFDNSTLRVSKLVDTMLPHEVVYLSDTNSASSESFS